jgi:hypothetical protein
MNLRDDKKSLKTVPLHHWIQLFAKFKMSDLLLLTIALRPFQFGLDFHKDVGSASLFHGHFTPYRMHKGFFSKLKIYIMGRVSQSV